MVGRHPAIGRQCDTIRGVVWRQVDKDSLGEGGVATVSVSQIESSRQNFGAAILVAGS